MATTRWRVSVKTLLNAIKTELCAERRRCSRVLDLIEANDDNTVDPDRNVPVTVGAVLTVPDYLWGFVAPSRDWHPAACMRVDETRKRATMIHGTGAEHINARYRSKYHLVEPSLSNGLVKPTAFKLDPRTLKLRPLNLIAPEHTLGFLDDDDFNSLWRAVNSRARHG
jgi:hypothetical protein